MGNQLAAPARGSQPESVAELPSVVYKEPLGRAQGWNRWLCPLQQVRG